MSGVSYRFKLVLIGDECVGKSTYVTRNRTGEFEKDYIATMGVAVNTLSFNTSAGYVTFNIWDTAGQERYRGLGDGYYMDADAAIIMFDTTSRSTYESVPTLFNRLIGTAPNAHIVLCGNKVDCKDRQVKRDDIRFHREVGIQYYDISAKSQYNSEKPFLYFIRKLLRDDSITIIKTPFLPPENIVE